MYLNSKRIFGKLNRMGFFNWMSDESFIRLKYRIFTNETLNLKNPKKFNEKLQWLKLNDRKQIYSKLVDKYEVKEYVSAKIGKEYIIPTLGVWDKFDDINFDELPDEFVLKCTHDSGGLVICRDKNNLDLKAAKNKIESSLANNYFYNSREWPYKNVKPRIIAEKFMKDNSENSAGLIDYKFYCFDGKVKYLYVSKGLENHATASISFLTPEWTFAPFGRSDYKPFDKLPAKPKNYEEMIKISEKLSKDYKFLRVDLYEIDNHIYFSELTFSPCSGMMPFTDEKYNYILGDLIKISEVELK